MKNKLINALNNLSVNNKQRLATVFARSHEMTFPKDGTTAEKIEFVANEMISNLKSHVEATEEQIDREAAERARAPFNVEE